jgi:GR25 family glycosyltransferase involved in LPS biosynthesis
MCHHNFNFDGLFPLKFVINLDKREDRLIEAKKEFASMGIRDVMRMPGKIYSDTRNHPSWNGALGCLFSHLAILRFAHDMQQNVMIFEDDVKFLNTEPDLLDQCSSELDSIGWDMFYGSANILKPCVQMTPHLARLSHAQSTACYGVRWGFIETLFKYFEKIDAPIDVIYADRVIPNHNCYVSIPMLAIQRDSYSDIEGQQANYSSYLEKRYWSNLVKSLTSRL